MKTIVWTIQAICLFGLVGLSGCASTTSSPITSTRIGTNQDQATIQALQKRLQERERTVARQHYQIEVMANQLDALKQIDQDTKSQRWPMRNSVTVAP
jgi:TolA-binding protein